MPRAALIVGLGLIGGSAGLALKRAGWRIRYFDPQVPRADALARGAADERTDRIDGEELVLLATPVDAALALLPGIHPDRPATSVCSVMEPLAAAARTPRFVPGHPLAGSQDRGLAAADAALFDGATWFLARHDQEIERLISDCGAKVEIVDPAEHDAGVAMTSHLPQVLSTALAALLADRPDALRFAGSGLRTFLRLAGSDAGVWRATLEANRANIAPQADAVAAIARQLVDGDPTAAFEKAQKLWKRLG